MNVWNGASSYIRNGGAILTIRESKEHPALYVNHQFHLRFRLFTLSIA